MFIANFFVLAALSATVLAGPFDGKKVLLKADNDKFLCRQNRGGIQIIRAVNSVPGPTCYYEIYRNGDDTYSFRADNYKYLSRIHRDISYLEAIKDQIDAASRFTAYDYDDGKISLRGNNGKYVTRADDNDMEITGDIAGPRSQFAIAVIEVAGVNFDRV